MILTSMMLLPRDGKVDPNARPPEHGHPLLLPAIDVPIGGTPLEPLPAWIQLVFYATSDEAAGSMDLEVEQPNGASNRSHIGSIEVIGLYTPFVWSIPIEIPRTMPGVIWYALYVDGEKHGRLPLLCQGVDGLEHVSD